VVAAETAGAQARCNPPATFHPGLPRFQRTLIIPAASEPKRSFVSIQSTCPPGVSHRPHVQSMVSSVHCINDPQPEGHMASHIRRRKFLATLLGGAAAWPLAARAQQPADQMRRIGVLTVFSKDDPEGQRRVAALLQKLQELGWTDGRNVRIEFRW